MTITITIEDNVEDKLKDMKSPSTNKMRDIIPPHVKNKMEKLKKMLSDD